MSTAANSTASISNATQLLPALRALEQHEKLYIIQFLAAELSRQQREFSLPEGVYPVWSPYDSYGAAEVLLKMLEEERLKEANP
ncbi:MAG TPA: hypothetical protein PK228_22260 [Saprospiraceae bacterium]|nr:hypothetical protein [Saprospiraceae bacterium]